MVMLMERECEGWVPSGCMMELGSFAGAWEGFLFLGTGGGEDRSGLYFGVLLFLFFRGEGRGVGGCEELGGVSGGVGREWWGDGMSRRRWEDVMRGITICKRNLW